MDFTIRYEPSFRLVTNPVEVGKKKRRITLSIKDDHWYPDNAVMTFLFTQFGTMHIISGFLPKKITTENFEIAKPIQEWIGKMYKSAGKEPPTFDAINSSRFGRWIMPPLVKAQLLENHVIVPFSGGKDGAFHTVVSQKNDWNPHLVHIQNLNPAVCSEEKKYAVRVARKFKQPLEMIHLTNSVPANGFATMRSRDMFLVALMIPFAYKHRAKRIFIEGFGDESKFDLFSGQKAQMQAFNKLLNNLGLDISIFWHDYKEWQVIKMMIEDHPELLKATNSCFSYPLLKKKMREKHILPKFKKFPFFESQCGGCLKCYIINLARIVFDKKLKCDKATLRKYVERAELWQKKKSRTKGSHYDDPTLLYLLSEAKKKVQF